MEYLQKFFQNKKGQASAIDAVLVLLSITIFIVIIGGFVGDKSLDTQKERVKNDYSHSLLVSMLYCTINDTENSVYDKKTISDLCVMYFINSTHLNDTLITNKIEEHLGLYLNPRGMEWVFYGNHSNRMLWVPDGKVLTGRDISSSSTEIILPNGEKVRIYLFIKWI